jgi:hypothetical protein
MASSSSRARVCWRIRIPKTVERSFVGRPNPGSKKGANSLTGNSDRIYCLNNPGHDWSSIRSRLGLIWSQGSPNGMERSYNFSIAGMGINHHTPNAHLRLAFLYEHHLLSFYKFLTNSLPLSIDLQIETLFNSADFRLSRFAHGYLFPLTGLDQ